MSAKCLTCWLLAPESQLQNIVSKLAYYFFYRRIFNYLTSQSARQAVAAIEAQQNGGSEIQLKLSFVALRAGQMHQSHVNPINLKFRHLLHSFGVSLGNKDVV